MADKNDDVLGDLLDVMKAYNADMSPKDAAAMIKKKVK